MRNSTFQNAILQLKAPLRTFAMNLTRDRDDALDLVQETYIRALTNESKFNEGTNLKAWLLTIMKNIFINNYRKNSRQFTVLDASENMFLLNSSDAIIGNQAESDFVMKDLTQAVNHLDAEYKKPFIMHFNGFKYEEIAEEMQLPLGTVKSRIFFARKQMKDFLKLKGIEG